ncbi:hypothetical protein GCM10010401_08730 [Rarobacter faecitabidus]|uniref:Uncharacterized protein n=1 Tax=Rarobacter faecitabidus TaxID=13243 RepID=A0A542ZAW8_RARFA|nr:hypothetical protein [Rarobacter faecitabidus]TQL57474.1 hypothetical protein FB461_2211 [Rarobacter faecitabidus]
MSLHRRSTAVSTTYRAGYLQSPAWWARRFVFLIALQQSGSLACVSCTNALTVRAAHLHHLSYGGVVRNPDGSWSAEESDEDLVAMCVECHRAIHDLFDHHKHWHTLGRRGATLHAIAHLRRYRLTADPTKGPHHD